MEFRRWLRSGPTTERLLAAWSTAIVVSLLLWVSIPNTGSAESDALGANGVTNSQQPGPAAASGPGGAARHTTGVKAGGTHAAGSAAGPAAAPRTGVQNGLAGSSGAGPSAIGSDQCGQLTATDQGITDKTITIGYLNYDLGSADSLIDLPSLADDQKAENAIVDYVNSHGGVQCRKLVLKFYVDGVLDTSQEHSQCLQMQQDKLFAVMNNLFNTTEQTCIPKADLPNFWATPPHLPDVQKYSPYIMSYQPNFDQLIHHYIHGAQSLGWFDGMKKLGILEQTCYPDENTAIVRELKSIGVDPSKASVFNYGCDSSSAAGDPSKDQAAALQFKRAGVTHIVNVAYALDTNFSRAADQQQYHPKFAHMEDASATAIQTGTQKPGDSYDNTLLIETIQTGGPNTPGYTYNKPTMDCTKIMHSVGLPGPQEKPSAVYFGLACNHIAMFAAAANLAPALVRSQLASGLAKVGDIDLSYPAGPERYNDPRVPTGGQYWRPGRWYTSCECWRVTDVQWRRNY